MRRLSVFAKKNMLDIFNKVLESGESPKEWKTHIIVPILKPGKPRENPHSFRPVSLLSCVGKTFERIIYHRLEWYVENQNLLPSNQFGCRKMRSVHDCLNLLNLKVQETYSKNHYFIVAFLDILGAYDNVNLELLYNQLTKCKVSKKICDWVYKYYKNREFYVRTENSFLYKDPENDLENGLVGPFVNSKGLCQGSILSGLLYIMYVVGMEKKLQNNYTMMLQFVDDLTVGCTGANLNTAKKRLQNKLNVLHSMLNQLQLDVSVEKCKIVIFTRHRTAWRPNIKIGTQNISVVPQAKLLGVWFDQKSNWDRQILEISNKCQKGINLLRSICGVSWGAHPITMLNLYKAIIRSHFDYSSMLIGTATNTRLKRLDTIQYRALRLILGQLQSSPKHLLNYETLELPLKIRREFLTAKYYIRRKHIKKLNLHKQLLKNKGLLNKPYYNYKKKPLLVKLLTKYENLCINATDIPYYYEANLNSKSVRIECDDYSFKKSDLCIEKHFYSFLNSENPDVCLYTDGSVNRDLQLSSYGIYNESNNERWGHKIQKVTSSWEVEILAIFEAVKYLSNNDYFGQQILIMTDSKSAVQSLKINNWRNNNKKIVTEIKNFYQILRTRQNFIKIVWIPGHQGINGNEIADKVARESLHNGQIYPMLIPDSENIIIKNLKMECENKFMEWYYDRGKLIGKEFCMANRFYPQKLWFDYKMWRKLIVTITRLRCGHGRWPFYLHRMGMTTSSVCICGEEGDINHVILGCSTRKKKDLFYKKIKPFVNTFPVNIAFLTSQRSLIFELYKYIVTEGLEI